MKMTSATQLMNTDAPASAQTADKSWKRRLLPGALAVTLLALSSTSANAIEFTKGEWWGNFDTTVSYGAIWRTTGFSDGNVGKAYFNPYAFSLSNAEQQQATGRWSVNNDDGDRNYPDGGDLVANTIKLTSEFDLRYKNYGFFTRFMGFYDFLNHNQEFLSEEAIKRVGKDVRLLDLYVWGENDIGEHVFNWRVGRQVVSWGESTFIQGGINIINPVDVSRLRVAGAELKEAFEGVNMVWGSIDLTESLSFEALYMLEFREIKPDPAGAFFSTNDIATPGGSHVMLGFGTLDQPVINPDLYQQVCIEEQWQDSDSPNLGLPVPGYDGGVVQLGCERSFPRTDTIKAKNGGQFGLSLRYYAEQLHGTEFGLYYINYHSRLPLISGSAVTSTDFRTGQYWTEYPENIHLFGASFNTTVGTWALSGEVTYRPNAPLQIDDVEILFAGLTPLNVLFPAPALQFHSQLGDFEAGELITGYEEHSSWQGQVTTTKLWGPENIFKAGQLAFVTEVGLHYVPGLPPKHHLRFNGEGTDTGGGPGYDQGELRNPVTDPTGFADDFSWGYRMLMRADYYDVIGSWTISPRVAWAQDVSGTTPGPGGSFIDGRKQVTVGVAFNYIFEWNIDISYTSYFGGGQYNLLYDRDFISASVSYSF